MWGAVGEAGKRLGERDADPRIDVEVGGDDGGAGLGRQAMEANEGQGERAGRRGEGG